jgi:hypothetical protein
VAQTQTTKPQTVTGDLGRNTVDSRGFDPNQAAAEARVQSPAPKDIGAKTVADLQAEIARLQAQAAAAAGATGVKPPDAPAPIVHASEETLGKTKSPSQVAAEDQVTAPAAGGGADNGRFRRTKAEMEAGLDVEEAKKFRASGMTLEAWLAWMERAATASQEPEEEEGPEPQIFLTREEADADLTLHEAARFRASGVKSAREFKASIQITTAAKAISTVENLMAAGADRETAVEIAKKHAQTEPTPTHRGGLILDNVPAPIPVDPSRGLVGIVLLVDALPVAGLQTEPLEPYLEKMARQAAQFGQVPDYRLVDYGKGQGYLAGLIRENPPAPGVYTVSSYGPTAKLALETLLPMASLVIRGV